MKITPLDLRKPDFKKSFKGYEVDEVRGFMAAAADTLEEVLRENLELKNRSIELTERLKNYQNMENTLNETLILAQKAGESARVAAQRESELIVAKAEVEAEKTLDGARSRLRELKYELERLEEEKQAFLVKMRSLVASQWKILQDEAVEKPSRTWASLEESFEEEAPEAAPETTDEDFGMLSESADSEEETETVSAPESPADQPAASVLKPDHPSGRTGDSVKDLSHKLGEFLRSKEAEEERETLDREGEPGEAGNRVKGSGLAWGDSEEAAEGEKGGLFWGDMPPEDEAPEQKGSGKK